MDKRVGALAILLPLSACVTPYVDWQGGETQAATELIEAAQGSGMPPEAKLSPEAERLRWSSEDWTAGRIRQIGDDYLVVDSVIPGVGSMRLSVPPEAVIFDGRAMVSFNSLQPGEPVRTNFVGKRAATPLLVSLEVLSPEQLVHLARK